MAKVLHKLREVRPRPVQGQRLDGPRNEEVLLGPGRKPNRRIGTELGRLGNELPLQQEALGVEAGDRKRNRVRKKRSFTC